MENNNKIDNEVSHKGHRSRLRNAFNNTDVTTMPEHQILELMLSFVLPQRDVNPLAHKLLDEFGCLTNVLESSAEDLKKIKGVGEVVSNFLSFWSGYKHRSKFFRCHTFLLFENLHEVRGIIKSAGIRNIGNGRSCINQENTSSLQTISI